MSYEIVFFDIDGTLVNEQKQIPSDTKEAVRELKAGGTDIVICTGRAPFHSHHIAKELGIDSFICFNGSYVEYKGSVIHQRHLPPASIRKLEEMARAKEHPIVFLSGEACYATCENHPHVAESFDDLKLPPPGFDADYADKQAVLQALLYCQSHEEMHYAGLTPDLELVRWHKYSMDVVPARGSKADGIRELLTYLQIDPSKAAAFGDGLNDKQMLSYVGMGIAMGNAHEELKPYAKRITKHVNDGGIRYGLEQIGLL